MSLSLNTYGGTVGVTFLLSQFITYAAANPEPQETYVQQNGSLDGYVENESSSEIPQTATETATETQAEVGKTSSIAAEAETVTGTNSAEWAANTLETGISATESPTTTEWWTPESGVASATSDAEVSTDAASQNGNEISTSTTEWWTPESEVATATANTDTTTNAAFQSENEISTPSTTATSQLLTEESQAAVSTPETTATYSEWTPTSITATSATGTAAGSCGTAWAQCGGEGFTGADCCVDGLTCVTVNSYWAKCVSASTLASLSISDGTSSTSEIQTTSVSTIYGESVYSTQITVHTTDSAGSTVNSIINSNYVSTYEKGVSSIATYVNSTNSANLGHNFPLGETKENSWKIKAMIAGLVGLSVVLGGL